MIFDLDGTLWDAALPVSEIWTEIGKKRFGEDYFLSEQDVRNEMGKTMEQIIIDVAPKLGSKEERDEFANLFLSSETEYLKNHPGILFDKEIQTLKKLKEAGHRLFIVSNCQTGYIENYLPCVDKGLFEDHMCWSDTKKMKHFTILAQMERAGVKKAIYIGDTLGDEKETHVAGLPFIHADYGYGECASPEGRAKSFEDLINVIEKVEESFLSK